MYSKLFTTFLIVLSISCSKKKSALFELQKNTGINFTNTLNETKDLTVFNYRNFYNGGGVATGDINNDGLVDVFFTANQVSNKLYINKGNFNFEDISTNAGFTEKKQWSTGVTMVDINQDGWLDIYVCNAGNMFDSSLRKNQLFINNKNLTFTEAATAYGLDDMGYTTHASFFDYDMDGDLDCFIINNSPIPVNALNHANNRDLLANQWDVAPFLRGGGDHLYQNNNGIFKEVSKQVGIHGSLISLGLGVTVSDINNDGYPDVYVSNDFYERDYLYINQGNGTFKDELEKNVQHTSLSSMGADIQDINNDGLNDIFTTDMLPSDEKRLKMNTSFENYDQFMIKYNNGFYNQYTQNALQVNNGNNQFMETGFYSGVAASDWSWGALMFDADNDGLNDIYVSNGIYRDVTDQDFIDFFANDVVQEMTKTSKKEEVANVIAKMPSNAISNNMFHNTGNLKFEDKAKDWGMDIPSFSNGAAYADFDNDGDLDVIVNNVNQEAFVFKNTLSETTTTNYLKIQLAYQKPNQFAIGTKVLLYCGMETLTRELIPSRGFQSSVDYTLHIGLGKRNVDSIKIIWPNRTYDVINKPSINTILKISYTNSTSILNNAIKIDSTLFAVENMNFLKHQEDPFIDFNTERNVPFMLSRLGPKAAVADVNGDGLEDVFIGAAKDQESNLYLQTKTGFEKKNTADFKTYAISDVTAALFVDIDNDGDKDLITGGGGNFTNVNNGALLNLVYINDGNAAFTLYRGAMPVLNTNCAVIVPVDIDNDNNLDLFVGSRSTPQNYGTMPKSYILKNDGKGKFTDITNTIAPSFETLGMVTDATITDINNDGKKDLIVIGEYMSTRIFTINTNAINELNTGLEDYVGWWQTVKVTDIDKDGDMDLLLGNLGENFYMQPTTKQPINVFIKDFDQNGSIDKIFSKTINDKDVPVFTKRELTELLPSQKKQNFKHKDYANKTIGDLFGEGIKTAKKITVNYSSNAYAVNDGKGNFTVKKLPEVTQLSSIHSMLLLDVNNDGYEDIICAGNYFDLMPQFCRIDASFGNVLLNDAKGGFTIMPAVKTGLSIQGQVKDIAIVNRPTHKSLIFLQNNDFPKMYTLHKK